MRPWLRKTLAIGSGSLACFFLVLSGVGLLYWIRTPTNGWPGPRVVDALPLAELPHFDRIPLVVYVLVWSVVALALGLLVRASRLERLPAAAVLTIGTGLSLYAVDVVSLYIVRQIPWHSAIAQAAHIRAIYLPAVLAGLAGALFGRARDGSSRNTPLVLAILVAAVGILSVVSAATPAEQSRLDLLHRYVPKVFPPVATAAVAAAGLLMILVARGLARRKRRAWVIATALLASASVFHVLKGLDVEEGLIVALILAAFVASRSEFDRPGDPSSRGRAVARLGVFVGAIYTYGIGALLLRHLVFKSRPFSLAGAIAMTTRALVSLHLPANERLSQWFPLSLALIAIAGVIAVAAAWLAPWRFFAWDQGAQRARARAIVRRWGTDSLAPFTLRSDKSLFFAGAQESFLAYHVVGGVAFVSGDPVGPLEEAPALMRAFLDFAAARDWQVAILGASERLLPVYEDLELHSVYWGDEALIDVGSFSLEGRTVRKTRQSVHRLERAGYTAEFRWANQCVGTLGRRLSEIDRVWQGDKPRRGKTMAMDDLFRLRGKEALFVIGRDGEGKERGFLHLATCRAGSTLSLSGMPRLRDTPNGFNEWLIVRTVEWARANGFAWISLNFSPFARLITDDDASGVKRLTREALLVVKERLQLQLDNLSLFNHKFIPRLRPRYIVYQRRAHLPRIGIAGLAAEGYLRRSAV